MAEKKYYWIKLKTDFFEQETIDFLLSQKNGCEYIVLYQMLCLNTANGGGELCSKVGEMIIPYNIEKIVRDTKYFDFDTVTIALELFKKLGLVYEQENDILKISDIDEMVGSETKYAEKMRKYREKKKEGYNVAYNVAYNVRQEIELDIDKDIDIDINKDIDIDINTICSEQNAHSLEFISLPLNDKTNFSISEDEVNKYQELYPNVDVSQELRNMKGWLDANPTKRKTKRGINRFVNGWLQRKQDTPKQQTKQNDKDWTWF